MATVLPRRGTLLLHYLDKNTRDVHIGKNTQVAQPTEQKSARLRWRKTVNPWGVGGHEHETSTVRAVVYVYPKPNVVRVSCRLLRVGVLRASGSIVQEGVRARECCSYRWYTPSKNVRLPLRTLERPFVGSLQPPGVVAEPLACDARSGVTLWEAIKTCRASSCLRFLRPANPRDGAQSEQAVPVSQGRPANFLEKLTGPGISPIWGMRAYLCLLDSAVVVADRNGRKTAFLSPLLPGGR